MLEISTDQESIAALAQQHKDNKTAYGVLTSGSNSMFQRGHTRKTLAHVQALKDMLGIVSGNSHVLTISRRDGKMHVLGTHFGKVYKKPSMVKIVGNDICDPDQEGIKWSALATHSDWTLGVQELEDKLMKVWLLPGNGDQHFQLEYASRISKVVSMSVCGKDAFLVLEVLKD